MTSENAENSETSTYPRRQEVMWKVPNVRVVNVDSVLLAEARTRIAPLRAENEKATPEDRTAINEHFAWEIDGRLVDPKAENVTLYSQWFSIELKDPDSPTGT